MLRAPGGLRTGALPGVPRDSRSQNVLGDRNAQHSFGRLLILISHTGTSILGMPTGRDMLVISFVTGFVASLTDSGLPLGFRARIHVGEIPFTGS